MKRFLNKILLFIPVLFLVPLFVYAQECSYEERARLNGLASKVTVNYEIVEEEKEIEFQSPDSEGIFHGIKEVPILKVSIYNITEDLYVIETNDSNKEEKIITHDMTDSGVYKYNIDNFEKIVKYTYKILSDNKECPRISLGTFTFLKPKYNMYSQYGICKGNENLTYCQKYITEDLNISPPELLEKVSEVIKQKEEEDIKTPNKVTEFIKSYRFYIIGGVIFILIITSGYIIVRKRRVL